MRISASRFLNRGSYIWVFPVYVTTISEFIHFFPGKASQALLWLQPRLLHGCFIFDDFWKMHYAEICRVKLCHDLEKSM